MSHTERRPEVRGTSTLTFPGRLAAFTIAAAAPVIAPKSRGDSFAFLAPRGSTAERVIQTGELPVLIVARGARRGYRRPVLCVELTDASIPLISLGLSVLDISVTDATLIHAYHGRALDEAVQVSGGGRGLGLQRLDSLAAQLHALQQSARAHGVKWRTALVRGDASRSGPRRVCAWP